MELTGGVGAQCSVYQGTVTRCIHVGAFFIGSELLHML